MQLPNTMLIAANSKNSEQIITIFPPVGIGPEKWSGGHINTGISE